MNWWPPTHDHRLTTDFCYTDHKYSTRYPIASSPALFYPQTAPPIAKENENDSWHQVRLRSDSRSGSRLEVLHRKTRLPRNDRPALWQAALDRTRHPGSRIADSSIYSRRLRRSHRRISADHVLDG